jgi:cob(I)alamin adenosyltransferase
MKSTNIFYSPQLRRRVADGSQAEKSKSGRGVPTASKEKMKIYTKTGDKGKTGLFGGERVSKSAVRLHAYGTIDELNALLGVIASESKIPRNLQTQMMEIQTLLFYVGADLATPMKSSAKILRIEPKNALLLEDWIDAMETKLLPLTQFILPSGSRAGALLHQARTTCRRAERWIVELGEKEAINHEVIVFVNRLSDYLFVAARYVNMKSGIEESPVNIKRK